MKTLLSFVSLGCVSLLLPNILSGCAGGPGNGQDERVGSSAAEALDVTDTPLGPAGVNEPALAVNPTNAANIATSLSYRVAVSTDNGATFSAAAGLSTPAGESNVGDTNPAFDSTGRLFACHIGHNATGNDILVSEINPTTATEISMHNVTASAGIPLLGHDRDWLAGDRYATSPFHDRLYVAWTNRGNNTEIVAYSSDHGSTWQLSQASGAAANVVSLPAEGTVWQNHIAVAANGDVYLAYHSQTTFNSGVPDGTSGGVIVLRSTDGGQHFNQRTLAYARGLADPPWNQQNQGLRLIQKNADLTIGSATPWVVPDPGNSANVFVVAADDINNADTTNPPDVNVYIAKSVNSGVSFAAPTRVDSGPAGTQALFPTAAFDDKSQCLAVMWWDNRKAAFDADGANYKLDMLVRASTDDGATFGPEVQLDVSPLDGDSNAPLWNGPPNTWRIGEYNGLGVVNGIAHADWTSTDSSGNQQIVYNTTRVCGNPGVCGSLVTAPCSATVVGGGTFGTLQAAVNAAANGAAINVTGKCIETVAIAGRLNLTIQGTPPAGGCGVNGPASGDLVSTVEGFNVSAGSAGIVFKYLNVINSAFDGLAIAGNAAATATCNCIASNSGNGISETGAAAVSLTQNLITLNSTGSISTGTAGTVLSNNTIVNNRGYGVFDTSTSAHVISTNVITGNSVGGVDLFSSSFAAVNNNTINTNGDGFVNQIGCPFSFGITGNDTCH
jgi:hypothetical protein